MQLLTLLQIYIDIAFKHVKLFKYFTKYYTMFLYSNIDFFYTFLYIILTFWFLNFRLPTNLCDVVWLLNFKDISIATLLTITTVSWVCYTTANRNWLCCGCLQSYLVLWTKGCVMLLGQLYIFYLYIIMCICTLRKKLIHKCLDY